ncbi:hypothetical protein [Solimonas sp. K1W22B-7]|uniref:hypothetical protein n=1 Tax=Solimonas sp. K1W22B-7 TaxID=2303331 RepID=UPI0013C47950|nr:hypothetical protein [Solimonas sp. K1W22B-7]
MKVTNLSSARLAWLSVLAGGLLAGAALLWDSWRGPGLPAGSVALVGEHTISREEWLRALQSVQGDSGRALDAAARARILQRLVDEELLFQHALASGLVRDEPGLRKTVIAALVDGATAGGTTDEAATRALFDRQPQRYAPQPRLRVAALLLPAGAQAPDAALLRSALEQGQATAPLLPVTLPDTALPVSRLAQYLGGGAVAALQSAQPGQLLGPLPAGDAQLYLLLRERQQDSPHYEDVAEAVRSDLARQQADAALARLLEQLRRDIPVKIAPDAQP